MTLVRPKGTQLATLASAGLVGAGMLVAVLRLQEASYKAWVVLIAIAVAPTVLAVIGRPKELLLFGWVFSLTYNRQYFIFEPLVGYQGTEGPYVLLSDVCLAGLFGLWLYERMMRRTTESARSAPLWPWYLPFATVCFLSIFDAARPEWAAFEMIRIVKIGLVLYYVRHNFGRKEWYVTLAALGAAACFQSAVAIKEMVTGKQGLIGLSQPDIGVPGLIEHFEGGAFTGGVRGSGTMAHPPYLSCYLLLVIPVLLAVSLSAARRRRALAAATGFLLASGGLAATLSRAPWVIACLQAVLVLGAMVLLRQVAVQRALAALILGSFVLLIALVPYRDKLMERLTGDFKESMQFREDGLRASLAAIEDRPILGFGLNNTAVYLGQYMPEMEWGLSTEEFASRELHLRAPITLGNGFLHVLEETGVLGFLGFLLLVLGAFVTGFRAMARTAGEPRAVCFALMVGILGALAEQVVDAPLWVDPVLFTFVLFIGMLNVAGALFGNGAGSRKVAA
ncbi:MAG TPA: O-antigen ligase family protein [Candidatus Sulfopaludibacter sp.]|nr:O-antigen ligase family protein [Candidatus Sulfopaludibacter sp.]